MIVGEDLELGVEIQVEVDETCECRSRVATWESLKAVVNLVWVARTNFLGIVQLQVAFLVVTLVIRQADIWLADIQEVWTQASDKPLDEDLENGGRDERVQETNNSIVEVPEGANSDLHQEKDEDGDQARQQGGGPDGDDFISQRIRKLGVHDLAIGKCDGKGS